MAPPSKKARLLSDDSASEDESEEPQWDVKLKINDEYAKRFEHNKKREELHRLQEKYGESEKKKRTRSTDASSSSSGSDSDSDSSESEDDEGELATEALDAEISATLHAIQSKDPRVYDKNIKFYAEDDDTAGGAVEAKKSNKEDKPITLRDYHRRNLLDGDGDVLEAPRPAPTYNEEQEALKKDLLAQINTEAPPPGGKAFDSDSEDDFLIAKERKATDQNRKKQSKPIDPTLADRDPTRFLTEYVTSRSWVPAADTTLHEFESDDDEEDERAERLEAEYNMRFEDPKQNREHLISHARDASAKQSVRREEPKSRKKARDRETSRKEEEKRQREEEKARLRNLKIEQAQEKLQQFKEAAGLRNKALPVEEWTNFLESGWDGENWDKEMQGRFDDAYYAEKAESKRPKWDDDIDIGDIDPEFDGENTVQQNFTLSDYDEDDGGVPVNGNHTAAETTSKPKSHKSKKKAAQQERQDRKSSARKERKQLEELVDQNLPAELVESNTATKKTTGLFRYRATSPSSFGLSAADILFAEDSQLNQYAGLKKLAAFRDQEKKAKDRKKLGKKARLRQWRRETFGDEAGGLGGISGQVENGEAEPKDGEDSTSEIHGKVRSKKRREHKKNKARPT